MKTVLAVVTVFAAVAPCSASAPTFGSSLPNWETEATRRVTQAASDPADLSGLRLVLYELSAEQPDAARFCRDAEPGAAAGHVPEPATLARRFGGETAVEIARVFVPRSERGALIVGDRVVFYRLTLTPAEGLRRFDVGWLLTDAATRYASNRSVALSGGEDAWLPFRPSAKHGACAVARLTAFTWGMGDPEIKPAVHPGHEVIPPVVVHQPTPVLRERQALPGRLVAAGIVDVSGRMRLARVVEKHPDAVVMEAALEALLSWRFRPAQQDGKAIPVIYTSTMENANQ